MSDASPPILTQTVLIENQRGLHARAAAKFVKLVETFPDTKIDVIRNGVTVCGQSIMGLMMLGAGKGSTLDLRISGPAAEPAMAALVALIQDKFHEE